MNASKPKNNNNNRFLNNNNNNNNNSNNNSSSSSVANKINNIIENSNKGNNYIYVILGVLSLFLVLSTMYYYYYHVRGVKTFVPKQNELLTGEHDARTSMDIPSKDIPLSQYSNEYAISIWLKVDDYKYKYGEEKIIFRRGNKDHGIPTIFLDPKDNILTVRTKLQHPVNNQLSSSTESFQDTPMDAVTDRADPIPSEYLSPAAPAMPIDIMVSNNSAPQESQLYDDSFFDLVSGNSMESFEDEETTTTTTATTTATTTTLPGANAGSTETTVPETTATPEPETTKPAPAPTVTKSAYGQCSVSNFPLQKWTNVIVSQYNSVIDIYIDGKLASSCVLDGFPLIDEEMAVLCPDGGFDGSISRLSVYNTSVTQDMAREIYNKGAVYSDSTFSSVPNYVYVIIFLLIVGLIIYSMYL